VPNGARNGFRSREIPYRRRRAARMAAFESRIIKWMFLFWVGQAITTVGLVFGVVRLTGH